MVTRLGVLRLAVCLLASVTCGADSLDDAARDLARKISARLIAGETPHVSGRNLSTLTNRDFTRAVGDFEHSLSHTFNRTPVPVEVVFTISQNLREYLLVAELQRADRVIEMLPYRPEPVTQAAKVVLDRRLLWEQESAILDVVVIDDRMLVLEPASLKLLARRGSSWDPVDIRSLDFTVPARDPRGRLQVSETTVTAHLPGVTCRGTWMPTLEVHCEPGDSDFLISEEPVKWIARRNGLASTGWPLFYSYGRIAEQPKPLFLSAEMDGRTHLYDAERRPAGVFDTWGSDFAVLETGCGAAREILVTSTGDRSSNDTIAVFEIVDRKPAQVSDPIEFPGPVTALWPAVGGTLAVARNLNSGKYAAYSIATTCSR